MPMSEEARQRKNERNRAYRQRVRERLKEADEQKAKAAEAPREPEREPEEDVSIPVPSPGVPRAATAPRSHGAPNYRVHVLVALVGATAIRLLGESGNIVRTTTGK